MTPDQLAIEGLAAQEAESLAGCVSRGQLPETFADVIAKLRGHVENLPPERRAFWSEQCVALNVILFPLPPRAPVKSTKPEASSTR